MGAIDNTANKFIGQGYTFPIVLNAFGRPDIKGGKDLIEASMRDILAWSLGTKFFLGQYGGKLEQLLQEPNDTVLQVLVKTFTVDLINQWEKRVENLDAELDIKGEGVLFISISYKITNTQVTGSFIYPYYSQLIY